MIFDIHNEADVEMVRRAIAGKKVGLTSGSYDLFHNLHLVYLQRCRRYCDLLIVGVDSDDLVRSRKGKDRPLVPEHQRTAIVSALACVQAAYILGSVEGFGHAVDILRPEVILKNDEIKEEILGSDKAKVIIIPDIVQHSSTTQIIDEILKRKNNTRV